MRSSNSLYGDFLKRKVNSEQRTDRIVDVVDQAVFIPVAVVRPFTEI